MFGFLGPNGAGKTTTIRMLVGLARPSSGSVTVLGQQIPDGIGAIRRRLGSLLENPSFYPQRSGRENLLHLAMMSGDKAAPGQIESLLDLVGLKERSLDRVRTYSHGMRQRLGLAAALLHDPELVILDEPATALDPSGIRDVRDLLSRLRAQGKTVFLSSHLLSEIEQICDQVCVMSEGRVHYQGPLADLVTGGELVRVQIGDTEAAERVAIELGWALRREGTVLFVSGVSARDVNAALAVRGLFADDIRTETRRLEDVFLDLIQPKRES